MATLVKTTGEGMAVGYYSISNVSGGKNKLSANDLLVFEFIDRGQFFSVKLRI
jgi:hypothetical protein